MEMPTQAAVMTLNNATLFPQALLPLYIFEPRYRAMLADALRADRMFSVAMQEAEESGEKPCRVAGLGLIRVSVDHQDGSSHLILQGLTRVQLLDPVQLEPYRVHAIRPLPTPEAEAAEVKLLVTRVHALVRQRFEQGALPFPFPFEADTAASTLPKEEGDNAGVHINDVLKYLERLPRPEELADLVACALLPDPGARQVILESVALEERFKKLIHFLMEEIRRASKNPHP